MITRYQRRTHRRTSAQDKAERLERWTIFAAVLGDPRQLEDLLEELTLDLFGDPWCRDVVAALHEDYRGPTAIAVHLARMGWRPRCSAPSFADAFLTDIGWHPEALPFYLGRLKEAADRRRVLARLVALADRLEHPGGPCRVAQLIGMES
jgi:hypothetical protein